VKGMILVAGLGTRLRPLSYELPKPVVPVLGRPLCTYNMEFLRQAGIKSFVMNLHTHPKLIQQRVTRWAGKGARVDFTREPVILGTGGGIWNAREFLKSGTFVTVNGDTVLSFPFASALAFHREKKALATLVLFPDPAKRYTPVWVGERERITGFGSEAGEGERSGFYTGCQIVEPELLHQIPPARTSCIIRETYTPLIAGGAPVFGFLSSGRFLEFGTPADYLEGTLALLSANRKEAAPPSPVDGGVTVIPPVYISPKAKVAPGTRIGPGAVIEEGATIAEGASVTRSILWPGGVLPAGEEIAGAILTPRRRVQVG
jgi:mannose-1-phosphate guanylyltransferase/phosphomannomutase